MNLKYPAGMPLDNCDALWRVEAKRYCVAIDPDRDKYGVSDPELQAWWYRVKRRTAKGAWINLGGMEKFVLLTANKRFACNTVAEALESFKARKNRQVAILKRQLAHAEADLALTSEKKPLFA